MAGEEGQTLEEAQLTGMANVILENNLSSVKIAHNSKGATTWEIKCKHEDVHKAKGMAIEIDQDLRNRYEPTK